MLIDWFTVCAQAINFFILVWLLKRFLYKPILRVMDERERRTAEQLKQAMEATASAQKKRNEYQRQQEEFERQKTILLKNAADEAAMQRQNLLDKARREIDALESKWKEALAQQQKAMRQELIGCIQTEVFAISEKVLTDLAATNLEDQMTKAFISRLGKLSVEEKGELTTAEALRRPVVVRSTHELSGTMRIELVNAIHDLFSRPVPVTFEAAPDLIGGIELIAGERKLGWNLAEYLSSMESKLTALTKGPNATPRPV